ATGFGGRSPPLSRGNRLPACREPSNLRVRISPSTTGNPTTSRPGSCPEPCLAVGLVALALVDQRRKHATARWRDVDEPAVGCDLRAGRGGRRPEGRDGGCAPRRHHVRIVGARTPVLSLIPRRR